MSERLEATRNALEALGALDYEPAFRLFTPDYVHHSNALGLELRGQQEARDKLLPALASIDLRQRLEQIVESDNFVIATMRSTSKVREGESTIVYVCRFDGDRIAEVWALSNPLPVP